MRRMAGAFSAEKTTREGTVRPLRLLPQPVYRFSGDHPEVLDACVFAFVEETDPEILLLIEAQKAGKSTAWMYALARMNSIPLRVTRDQEMVWETSLLRWGEVLDQPGRPYTVLRVLNPPTLPPEPNSTSIKPVQQ